MGVFSSGGVGIDLGSANVTIFLESEGVVLREPSYVLAARDDPDNVLACGRDARQKQMFITFVVYICLRLH